MQNYKVCVYAICKNEEKFVDRWVDSMSEADLIVVTDTGSKDNTVDKLRKRGAIVYVEEIKPWRFDTARNISLDHVPEDVDICVCTDIDEVFEAGWRDKLEKAWKDSESEYDGEGECEKPVARKASYMFDWRSDTDGETSMKYFCSKTHSRQGFRWKWPVHEYIYYTGHLPVKSVTVDGMLLGHYPDPHKSRESYLPLLELAVEETPLDDRMRYYLGREYMYREQWQKCIDTLTHYLALPTAIWNEERCAAMRWIAKSFMMLKKTKKAYSWYYKAIAEAPEIREPYIEFALMCYKLKDWNTTFFLTNEALKIKKKSCTYINMCYSWDFTPDDLCAIAAYNMNIIDKALEHAKSALTYAPNDERLKNNLKIIEETMKKVSARQVQD